jgi:hypothetical protein
VPLPPPPSWRRRISASTSRYAWQVGGDMGSTPRLATRVRGHVKVLAEVDGGEARALCWISPTLEIDGGGAQYKGGGSPHPSG